jgi:hypothetical protein
VSILYAGLRRARRLRPFKKNTSRAGAAAHPLGRARRLGARRRRGLGGALGLELFVATLAVGGLGSGDLGLVHAHIRYEGGARRVDVGLEAGVDGAGVEVPEAPLVHARHQSVGHAELALDLYAHVHLLLCVEGRLSARTTRARGASRSDSVRMQTACSWC